jgi:DNA (cytosine-5)-methyltransferase 1
VKLKALDLFSGLGGFSLGLDRAGIETSAFCEIDPRCVAVIKHHWQNTHVFGDVKNLNKNELLKKIKQLPDLICGGYPCTGHSVAGKKKGFENESSSLWREYHRLAGEIKPRYCIIENSHNLRSTGLAEILKAFDEIGYHAEFSIISAYSIGAPHQRERIFIVFWRADIPYPNPFRYWEADPKKAETSQGWWSKRRFKRNPVFGKIPQAGSGVLQLADGVSRILVEVEEYKIAMLGNALIPQIPELIGRALVEHEESLNE